MPSKVKDILYSEWSDQCNKLEAAGYHLEDPPPSLTKKEEVLLTQQYLLDKEEGRKHMRQLALVKYSKPLNTHKEILDKLELEILDNRDDMMEHLHKAARQSWVSNFTAAVDISKSQFFDHVPIYKWIGVSRTYMNKNVVRDRNISSYSHGTTPSTKTLYQISSLLGIHPSVFLFDETILNLISHLYRDNDKILYHSKNHIVQDVFTKVVRCIKILRDQHGSEDSIASEVENLTSELVSESECSSNGGKMGVRITLEHQDPPELLTALSMAFFCHELGSVAPDWLITADDFPLVQEEL